MHRRFYGWGLLVVALAWCSLSGCGGTGGPGGGEEPGNLRGQVVDASNPGKGIDGAVVRVAGTNLSAVTGADGSYQLTGVPDGPVTLIVELPGVEKYEGMQLDMTIPPGETVDLAIKLLPRDLDVEPARIELQPQERTLGIQEEIRFQATVLSEEGMYVDVSPTWFVETDGDGPPVGVVSREGTFIGTNVGTGRVVAQVGDLVAKANVTVVGNSELARLSITPCYPMFLRGGQRELLLAFAINGAGQMMRDFQPEWSVEPDSLGTLEEATLSPEELEWRVYECDESGWGPWTGGGVDDSSAGVVEPPSPEKEDPDNRSRKLEVIPEAVSVRYFVAGNESGKGQIKVSFGGKTRTVDVEVHGRGQLQTVELWPQEAAVAVGQQLYFYAAGLNEEGWPISGLEYEWSLANGLGTLEEVVYWTEPGWEDGGQPRPLDPTTGSRHRKQARGKQAASGAAVRPKGESGSMPPEDRPFWDDGSSARVFTARQEGAEILTVTVTDPVANVTQTATATIKIVAAPELEAVKIDPPEAEVEAGTELYLWAYAVSNVGDWLGDVQFEWTLEGDIGELLAPEVDENGQIRPLLGCGWPVEGNTSPASNARGKKRCMPAPGSDWRVFKAGERSGEGTVTVRATQASTGRTATATARVVVVGGKKR